jgi:hypothetical protein
MLVSEPIDACGRNRQRRTLVMREFVNTRDGATLVAGFVWGLRNRLELDGAEAHDLVGRSVPNFAFDDGRTVGELMRDGLPFVLDFTDSADVAAVAREHDGARLKLLQRGAQQQLGLAALFVRADGIVAWALDAGQPFDAAALRRALERWVGK